MVTRLMRLLPKLTTARASISSSSPSTVKRLFSSTPSSSSCGVVSSTAADVANVGQDDADEPVYSNPATSSAAEAVLLPTLLQPRVVVFDGVCHLCHGGQVSKVPFSFLGVRFDRFANVGSGFLV